MKYLYGFAVLCCLLLWSSCRNDFESVPSTGKLEFSRDTVYLDTIFSNIGSSTYTLKVYNRSKDDINIPSLKLSQGEASNYRLNVDGMPGKIFKDVQILAKDSIFIFIETTLDINNLPGGGNNFLYTDQLLFDAGANEQRVELVTLVQDAVFLYPEQYADGTKETINIGVDENGDDILIEGFFLDDDQLNFTDEKPYVIYGYAAVPPNKALTIQAGARVHFHAESGILVARNASIKSLGAASSNRELMENEVIFQGDRLEPSFANVPGQWGFIWLSQESVDNEFNYTSIKNGTVGVIVDKSPVSFKNVQIYNSSNIGLLARTADIYGENMVISNSGQSSLAIQLGGSYTFNHSTFANYWVGGFRNFSAVSIDNTLETQSTIFISDLVKADFTNCIIYGSERKELSLYRLPEADFNFSFKNTLIRFEDPNGDFSDNPLYEFSNPVIYKDIVLNEDPVFQNTGKNNLNIERGESAAENIGIYPTSPAVPLDLNGTPRSNPSDAGAYESVIFPED